MAVTSNSSVYSSNRPLRATPPVDSSETSSPLQAPAQFEFSETQHSDLYDAGQPFAAMLLSLLLRIVHPDISKREELMIYGQKPAPGVSEENLRSPGVSPLAIRRVS